MTDIISRSSVSKTRSPVVDSRFLSSQLSTRYPTDRILILPAFPSLLFLLSLLACVSLFLFPRPLSPCVSREIPLLSSLQLFSSLALCVRAWVCHSECLDACLSFLCLVWKVTAASPCVREITGPPCLSAACLSLCVSLAPCCPCDSWCSTDVQVERKYTAHFSLI